MNRAAMVKFHKLLANRQSQAQPLEAYGISIMVVLAALAFLKAMSPYFKVAHASVFHCGVLIASLVGGYGPGLLAVLLATLAFDYFYIDPVYSLAIADGSIFRITIFTATATFIALVGGAQKINIGNLRQARDDLKKALMDLERANFTLQKENYMRRAVQEELYRNEAFLAEAQKISQTGSWRWDLVRNMHVWSDELFRIYGFDAWKDIPSLELVLARIHSEDREQVARIVRDSVAQGTRFECKYKIIHPQLGIRHLHAIGCPVACESGAAKDYIGVVVDVSQQVEAESQLQKNEQQYRLLAENLPDGLVRYDQDLNSVYVNRSYERIGGFTGVNISGKPIEDYWHFDLPAVAYKETIRRVMRTGEPAEVITQWNGPDGKKSHLAIKIVAEQNIHGDTIGALAIGRDITALKRAEKELSESRNTIRELAHQNEFVREEERKHLARELHDDLAQYLLALKMKISLLDIEYGAAIPQLAGKTGGMIEMLNSSIKSVRNVMSALRPAALDMGIEPALEWLAEDFTARTGIRCTLNIKAKNIALKSQQQVTAFRVVQESLRNIEKHAQAGNVEISLNIHENDFLISVKDDGIGFDPSDKKPHSFGLIGMKERVLMLNGRIDMVTATGEGTQIHIAFPISTSLSKHVENFTG